MEKLLLLTMDFLELQAGVDFGMYQKCLGLLECGDFIKLEMIEAQNPNVR